MSVASIHNAGMKHLNSLVGWEDVYLNFEGRKIPIRGLISKNESAYARRNSVSTKEFKLCKLFVDDISELNTTYSLDIPIPTSSLKSRNINITVSNGNVYQIKLESTGSFNEKLMWVLEIERDI